MRIHRRTPVSEIISGPIANPVSVEDVISGGTFGPITQDVHTFINDELIPEATDIVQKLTERSLITQTRKQYSDCLPYGNIAIRFSPLQSISSITYTNENQVVQTLATSLYTVDINGIPGRIEHAYNATWPNALDVPNSVVITAVCGFGGRPDDVPPIYRRAIVYYCNHKLWNPGICEDEGVIRWLENYLAIEGRTVAYA